MAAFSGTAVVSITVTMQSRPRAVAATSSPIQPAPITTTSFAAINARERFRELQRPEVVHAAKVGAGNIEPPGDRTGGEQELVVPQPLLVVEDDLARERFRATARRPRRRSTSWSSYQSWPCSDPSDFGIGSAC